MEEWHKTFCSTVDDILLRSNVHTCRGGLQEYKRKYYKDQGIDKKNSTQLQDVKVINLVSVKHSLLKNYLNRQWLIQ